MNKLKQKIATVAGWDWRGVGKLLLRICQVTSVTVVLYFSARLINSFNEKRAVADAASRIAAEQTAEENRLKKKLTTLRLKAEICHYDKKDPDCAQ